MDENLLNNFQTKERSVNFTKSEMDRLQALITKHQSVLFCKKTDGVSSKQKESAWCLIHGEFNALGETPRTIKQLKYKFENLKRSARKGASKERQEMRRTGGGPPPQMPPDLNDATDWLRSVMPLSIDGNEAVYDDDAIIITKPENQPKEKKREAQDFDIEDSQHGKEILATETITAPINKGIPVATKCYFDPSTPYSSLKRPISSPLIRRVKKPKENCNVVKQMLQEKKITIMDNLQELELQKIGASIRHAQEIHEQTLRHNEERHKLEIEKLKIEIALLKNPANLEINKNSIN